MPAKSQAQRGYLNAKFGHKWVQKHHFDNAGKLPAHAKQEGMTARMMFHREAITEGRDDAPKLGLGRTELKFARMNSKEAMKPAKGGQSDQKWLTSMQARAHLAGENPSSPMKNKDAVGKVPHAFKESRSAEEIVAGLLND